MFNPFPSRVPTWVLLAKILILIFKKRLSKKISMSVTTTYVSVDEKSPSQAVSKNDEKKNSG